MINQNELGLYGVQGFFKITFSGVHFFSVNFQHVLIKEVWKTDIIKSVFVLVLFQFQRDS